MIKIISKPFINLCRRMYRNNLIKAVTMFPYVVIFYNKEAANNKYLCNHEAIHGEQLLEGWIVWHWILSYRFKRKYGIMMSPFESEAYDNQHNFDYIKTRKRNAWKKYL